MTDTPMWNDRQRALLDAILEQVIPANGARGVPSAASLGLANYLTAAASQDPALATMFGAVLARTEALADAAGVPFDALEEERRVAVIRQLEQAELVSFGALLRHTYMGYYSRPDIRALFGPSESPVHPDGYDVSRESPELMAELTEPVRRRGPLYRAC